MKYCRMCGKQLNADARFCRFCGYEFEVVAEPEKPKEEVRFCEHCGKQVSSLAAFCKFCGGKLSMDGEFDSAQVPTRQSTPIAQNGERSAFSAEGASRTSEGASGSDVSAFVQGKGKELAGRMVREVGNAMSGFTAPSGTMAPSGAGEFSLEAMPSNLVEVAKKIAVPRVETVTEYIPGKSFFGKIMKLVSVVSSFGAVYLGVLSKSLPVIVGTVVALFLSGILSKTKKARK